MPAEAVRWRVASGGHLTRLGRGERAGRGGEGPASVGVDFFGNGQGGALDVGISVGVSDGIQSRNTTQSAVMGFFRNLTLEDAHKALAVAGFVPGLGTLADAADAALYLYEGNYGEFALSAVAMLPVGGDAVKAAVKAGGGGSGIKAIAAKGLAALSEAAGGAKATKGGASAERASNVARGIPDSRLGPSGKPKIHSIDKSSKKAAREAAEQAGSGPTTGRSHQNLNEVDRLRRGLRAAGLA